ETHEMQLVQQSARCRLIGKPSNEKVIDERKVDDKVRRPPRAGGTADAGGCAVCCGRSDGRHARADPYRRSSDAGARGRGPLRGRAPPQGPSRPAADGTPERARSALGGDRGGRAAGAQAAPARGTQVIARTPRVGCRLETCKAARSPTSSIASRRARAPRSVPG